VTAQPAGAALPAAVLWDMDGTLVDTEPYWIERERRLVAEYGHEWTDEDAHALVGNSLLVSAAYIRDRGPVPLEPEEIVDRLLAGVVEDVRRHVPFRPGAPELLGALAGLGVPCALVTMSYRSLAAAVVDALPPGRFAVVVAGDDVTHGKPHPEPYLTAADRLGVPPEACVAIEDSPTGVASSVAAGVPTLAVEHLVPIAPGPLRTIVRTLEGWTPADLGVLLAGRDGRAGDAGR
jgi:HAD superfamily hydrolase (TIGR01509 family)